MLPPYYFFERTVTHLQQRALYPASQEYYYYIIGYRASGSYLPLGDPSAMKQSNVQAKFVSSSEPQTQTFLRNLGIRPTALI